MSDAQSAANFIRRGTDGNSALLVIADALSSRTVIRLLVSVVDGYRTIQGQRWFANLYYAQRRKAAYVVLVIRYPLLRTIGLHYAINVKKFRLRIENRHFYNKMGAATLCHQMGPQ